MCVCVRGCGRGRVVILTRGGESAAQERTGSKWQAAVADIWRTAADLQSPSHRVHLCVKQGGGLLYVEATMGGGRHSNSSAGVGIIVGIIPVTRVSDRRSEGHRADKAAGHRLDPFKLIVTSESTCK